MYPRILVPLDGSKLAEEVLPYVRAVGRGFHSNVELLRAVPPLPPELAGLSHAVTPHSVAASLSRRAQEYLDGVAADLVGQGLETSTAVTPGEPAACIVEQAGRDPDALIAMSTHGWVGDTRWSLGSVTLKVLQASVNPVLVVPAHGPTRPSDQAHLDTIIVTLDGSTVSAEGLDHAVALSKTLSLKLVLVRVAPPPWDYYPFLDHTVLHYGDWSRDASDRATEYLRTVSARLREQGVLAVEQRILRGDPATAIVDMVRETPNSLITMVTHGHGSTGRYRWTVGSVTQRVAGNSSVPILVVPAMEKAGGVATG